MYISDDIKYVGVNDTDIDLFEAQYIVKNGVSYNSYVITDEKIAVMDSVGENFADEWLCNIKDALDGRSPDYLVIQHMEPDHSANMLALLKEYPEATVVASAKALDMMKNFFGTDFDVKQKAVSEGDVLELGKHKLSFITAPMVHWPEVIMTYDSYDKILFSADGFGKFGAIGTDEPWEDEARRYYFGIVGKYGAQVQAVLKKAVALDISVVCPLHGPVLNENLGKYFNLYDLWSSYKSENGGVVVAYASIYGNTAKAADMLAKELKANGVDEVKLFDLARCDMSEAVSEAFRNKGLVLASATYNGGVFPPMREYIASLAERGFKERVVAFIENGSWAPMAAKVMKTQFEQSKNLVTTENIVSIKSAVNDENIKQIALLAREISDLIR